MATSYYVAVSLDGFIAREDEVMDWLSNYTAPLETPYDYEPFYKTVSAIVMGRKTYDKVLNFGEYACLACWRRRSCKSFYKRKPAR